MPRQKHKRSKAVMVIGVACLILLSPTVSLAWGPEAHKIIAQIAWDSLQPSTQKQITDLLVLPPTRRTISAGKKAFVDASIWADVIRTTKPKLNAEHFISWPFPAAGEPPEPNLVSALKRNLNLLQTSPDNKVKAEALKFIIHYVGDIHQPLHCATRKETPNSQGDFNGNLMWIMVADSSGKVQRIALHNYWDTGLDTFSAPKFNFVSEAKRIRDKNRNVVPNSSSDLFDFQAWSLDSFELAKKDAYANMKSGARVLPTYKINGLEVVDSQLAKAGFRLAKLLDAILLPR